MSGNSENLSPGVLLAGKYRIQRQLGLGGMGVVLAATHEALERPVAIKVIREELLSDAAAVERLLIEARATAKIQSEHVGQVLDVGTLESGAPFIVMEYLEGCDLATLLEEAGPLPTHTAVEYLLQACEAVAEAHRWNIVHRDLKPENLFLATRSDGSRIVKVLDFGIAKQVGDTARKTLTQPSTALGSPQYMSPEQMRAESVDARADVWALGAILYELIAGRPAFDGDTVPQVCAQVLNSEPPPLNELAMVAPELSDAVRRCLSKAASDRFPTIVELAAALSPFGTDRSRVSLQRIKGVARQSWVASESQNEAGQVFRVGEATEQATPSQIPSPPNSPRESHGEGVSSTVGSGVPTLKSARSPRGLVAVGAVTLSAIVGAAWWLSGSGSTDLETPPVAGATSPAAPEPPPSVDVPAPPLPERGAAPSAKPAPTDEGRAPAPPEATATAASAAGEPAEEVAPVVRTVPSQPSPTPARPRPTPHPTPRPIPAQSAIEPPSTPDPFDRDSFGGRR